MRLARSIVTGIKTASCGADLHRYLQKAVELEHSTIPPYLTALLSLVPGTNRAIAGRISFVVRQEMLHMAIASNILISLGGSPAINVPGFIPHYPGPLPMDIGNLTVGIEAFSKPLVKNIFMEIEKPEYPIPVQPPTAAFVAQDSFATIGEFYNAIKEKIVELGPSIFKHPTAPPQAVNSKWFAADQLFPIIDETSACRAIDLIEVQGEGSTTSPFESPGKPAHYYVFGEIEAGREIERTATGGFAYSGAPIPFDPAGVRPLKPNCKIADFQVGSQARTRIERFAYDYSSLLNALHDTFNGHPGRLDTAIGVMFDLRMDAAALMQTPVGRRRGETELTVGPSFEYVKTQGGISGS